MIPVYQADNLLDAHLVKGVLEHAGIRAYLAGEHLTGGMGELPVTGLLRILVEPEAETQARALIAEIRAAEPITDEELADAGFDPLPRPA